MIKKFLPGDYYEHLKASKPEDGEHMEHGSSFHDCRRMLAWMFYLNTVEDGGTKFTSYDLTTDCVEGRLVIWPAYWTHCHHGITSKTKTKYIATGWTCYI